MAGKNLRASIIVDLMGNIAQRSRQFSGSITAMAGSGQRAMQGLRASVISVSSSIDRLGSSATRMFGVIAGGGAAVAGLGYTANKLFINVASQRENMKIALNSLYKGDAAAANQTMEWIKQNAKESTWGLSGVMQEYNSSRGFGMSDQQARSFIGMLEDQGAYRGWGLEQAQGASMQLKQMYSKGSISAADAGILSGYGINAYQILADATGKDQRVVRDLGSKGKLGPKEIELLFQLLSEQAKGAQASAMNSWTGLTAQMGDVWEDFADKLMNKGPFERLKQQARDVLNWYDRIGKPGADGVSELDRITTELANGFNTAFNTVQSAARQTWAILQQGANALSWVDQHIVSLKTVAKVLGTIWLANKVLRLGGALMRPAWNMAAGGYRAGRRVFNRRRRGGAAPGTPNIIPNSLQGGMAQPVFVTNWPPSFGGGADVITGNGRNKRGPGRGRGRSVPLSPSLPAAAETAARPGFLSRMFGGAGKMLSSAGSAVSGWMGAAGQRLTNSAVGRLGARLGGPLLSAAALVPTMLSDDVSAHDKGSAVGGTAGAWIGGALGSIAGPLGTMAGATLGGVVGDYLGGFVTDLYSKWDAGRPADQTPEPEQKISAQAALRVELADGLRITSTNVQESGMGLDVFTGNNFYPY